MSVMCTSCMGYILILLSISIVGLCRKERGDGKFAFASYYGDHMVLQRGPRRAIVWGYGPSPGSNVTVTLTGKTPITVKVDRGNTWKVMLAAVTDTVPHTVAASSSTMYIFLQDVLFGDVWICSGQSNMEFTLGMIITWHFPYLPWYQPESPYRARGLIWVEGLYQGKYGKCQADNASKEISDAVNYQNIRVFTVAMEFDTESQSDLLSVEEPWSFPNKDSLGAKKWTYFSAVCWLYGKRLFDKLKYPIGLVASSWGGTPIEAWTDIPTLKTCGVLTSPRGASKTPQTDVHVTPNERGIPKASRTGVSWVPTAPSVLWNAMMFPLTNMTIYGAIWYQGEANANQPESYKCIFPVMINSWRKHFYTNSEMQTDGEFPFGFVQLSAWRNDSSISAGFPDIRWHQTADYGYVPNDVMQKVFMATAMDLPDYMSPFGSIHPRDKQDVADRLTLSGLNVAYGINVGKYQGPFPTSVIMESSSFIITYDEGSSEIEVRSTHGFEVCCTENKGSTCSTTKDYTWVPAPVTNHDKQTVTIKWRCASTFVVGIRYAWRESPCPFKKCAVYSIENSLPAPPFIQFIRIP